MFKAQCKTYSFFTSHISITFANRNLISYISFIFGFIQTFHRNAFVKYYFKKRKEQCTFLPLSPECLREHQVLFQSLPLLKKSLDTPGLVYSLSVSLPVLHCFVYCCCQLSYHQKGCAALHHTKKWYCNVCVWSYLSQSIIPASIWLTIMPWADTWALIKEKKNPLPKTLNNDEINSAPNVSWDEFPRLSWHDTNGWTQSAFLNDSALVFYHPVSSHDHAHLKKK